jgi:C-terminal processing protease CtpA/Prc
MTPGGTPIDRKGVQPDLEAATTFADLQQGDDPPVRRAVELLTAGPSQITR